MGPKEGNQIRFTTLLLFIHPSKTTFSINQVFSQKKTDGSAAVAETTTTDIYIYREREKGAKEERKQKKGGTRRGGKVLPISSRSARENAKGKGGTCAAVLFYDLFCHPLRHTPHRSKN
uniref:Uncharacterized protein n=1 Tax=Trypanosoma congolense (strain IL3000) TaxID=1068625 RepID=G0V047_TRYCI|nr:hypothetical protein, unlikely [Trypanosoma congolense IL3000]